MVLSRIARNCDFSNAPPPLKETALLLCRISRDAFTGKEVATLFSGNKAAGSYSVNFNGTDNSGNIIPSGTYIYRIDVTNAQGEVFSSSKKMTLSK